ncbi:molecular chaperone DnaJ [Candidatus Woesearchaeota archaeon]|nr:molecular chaperone DnaJ [Candidatus Woesearchaeota archaeon]
MAAKKDYYEILGVSKNASKEEIKRAYKNLAKKCHPDLNKDNPQASDKFKELNEAASVLGDDKKREHYDQFGTADTSASHGFNASDFSAFSEGFDMNDIFESIFGGQASSRKRRSSRGEDLGYEIEITLEEAAKGVKKNISVPKHEICEDCQGTGARSRDDIVVCEHCRGTGVYMRQQRTAFGIFQTSSTCNKCGGRGKVIRAVCQRCHGNARIKKTKKIEVTIPAGVDSGQRLRVAGEGEAGDAGYGDLYLIITVVQHDLFERDGDDLKLEARISFVQAALGGEIDIPTIDGKVKMKIPVGTQTNTIFRLAGKGIKNLRGYGSGDLFVKAVIQTPTKLSKQQKDLLEEFDSLDKETKKGLFDKLF